jgi:anti-anti-sigma regulatory factor
VQLAGPLDRGTVHLFQDAVSTLLLTAGPVWVVDATYVTTFDRMGVRSIGVAYRRAIRHDRRMRVIGTPPALRQELAHFRLDHHLLEDQRLATAPNPVPASAPGAGLAHRVGSTLATPEIGPAAGRAQP